ncbi:MAG: hypothetical protein HKN12_06130 [Gemmatimonadetes bacterium]|nr:hypothetical protein [Gemmatimonadota bacterium]
MGETDRRQQERNEKEWNDPNNWLGPRWLGAIYSSDRDTRVFVPKRYQKVGRTPNLGTFGGRLFLFGTLGVVVLALTLALAFGS